MLKTFCCQDLQIELMGKYTVLMVAKHLTIRVISVCVCWGAGMEWDCGPSWFREHLDASGMMRAQPLSSLLSTSLCSEVLLDACLVGFSPPVTSLTPGALQPGSDCGSTFTTASSQQPPVHRCMVFALPVSNNSLWGFLVIETQIQLIVQCNTV